MFATGWILVDRIISSGNVEADLPSLFSRELGSWAKVLASLGYLVIFYGILVAYLAGAASALSSLFETPEYKNWYLIGFFLFATTLTLFGPNLVRKGNAVFMLAMGVTFAILIFQASKSIQVSRLSFQDWHFLPSALPIVYTAFCFHPILVTATKSLDFDRRHIRRALLIGTIFPLLISALWMLVVVGALPLTGSEGSLLSAFKGGQPATVPLAAVLSSEKVKVVGVVFTVLAIITSYLAIGISLMGFLRDLSSEYIPWWNRSIEATITFLPPLAVSLIYPDLFLVALDLVGGVGITLVFGILPTLILLKTRGGLFSFKKFLGIIMLIAFIGLFALELSQEMGFLKIDPNVEYWMMPKSSG
jgi:tyrosine-specific transport protein